MARSSIAKSVRREFVGELALLYAATFNPDAAVGDRSHARIDAIKWSMGACGFDAAAIKEMDDEARAKVGYVTPTLTTPDASAAPVAPVTKK